MDAPRNQPDRVLPLALSRKNRPARQRPTGLRRGARFAAIGLVLPLLWGMRAQAASEMGPCARRQIDPITLEGEALQGLFDGDTTSALALYAHGPDGFRQIPFQIDYIGEDGLVIPSRVNRVMEKAVYDFIPNPDLPERIGGGRFELLFMAADAGERYPDEGLPEGFLKAVEIEVTDPVDGSRRWAYLMKPETPPDATAVADYVDYTLIQNDSQYTEQIKAVGYVSGFPDADKPFAYGYWIIPRDAGGDGENLLQTFRVRIKVRIMFFTIDLDPKNNIVPYVLGYNDGPIRVTRRVYSSIVLGGMKMDRFMGDAKLETESHYYGHYFYFDGDVSLPGLVKRVSKINAMFTTDFTHRTAGMSWYNAKNILDGGALVDGVMSPQEKAMDDAAYKWAFLVGPQGGWANLLEMHSEAMKPNMKLFYLDDNTYLDEKEPSVQGTWASTGYSLNRLDEVKDSVAFRTSVFAIPSTFRVPDTKNLVDLVYAPLRVQTTRTWPDAP